MSTIINASTSSGLIQTADTSGTLVLQSNGTTQQTIDSTGSYGQLKQGTAQASTSGTSIDFTGIPSWVKRITVMFNNVSTNGTSPILIQLGSGSFTTTGYAASASQISASVATTLSTTGFICLYAAIAANALSGQTTISNLSSNIWVSSGSGNYTDRVEVSGGSITLGGTLDRVRVTTVNGTDTFDAGSINILYEG